VVNGNFTYRIKAGDTLSSIAAGTYNTVAGLMAANPGISNANVIYAGSLIKVPEKRPN
jgi:LysM repeat protein